MPPGETLRRRDRPWYREDDDAALARAVKSAYEEAETLSSGRRNDDAFHLALYGNQDVCGNGYAKDRDSRSALRFNVIQSIVDTSQAEVMQAKPRPRFITNRGNWSMKRRAQRMEWAVEGELYRNDVYEGVAPRVVLSSQVTGTGAAYVMPVDGYPVVEHVYPGELVVHPVEAYYGAPRNMFRARLVDRESLIEEYARGNARLAALIESAPAARDSEFPFLPTGSRHDMVRLVQAWHLPAGAGAKDGRYAAVVGEAVLTPKKQRVWTRDHFPFAVLRWQSRLFGFWGLGIAEQLVDMQCELNYTLAKIQDIIHNCSTMRYYVHGSASVDGEQLTNIPGEIIRYFGDVPPIAAVVNAVPPELFQQADRIVDRAYQLIGVSQLSAAAKKPAGLNSGAALREHEDIESRRFIVAARAYEQWYVDLAKLVVEEKRELAERGDDRPVRVLVRRQRRQALQQIDWKDAALDEESYMLQVMPASQLPRTPAGRTATIEQWQEAGWISREQSMVLLDMPDLDDFMNSELAPYLIVLDAIEEMIEEASYIPPEPAQNLELTMQLTQSAILRHRLEGVPDGRLDLLYRYVDDAGYLLDQAMAAAAPPAAVPPGGPAALPAGPPGLALPPDAGAAMDPALMDSAAMLPPV